MKHSIPSILLSFVLVLVCRGGENQSLKVYTLSEGLTIQIPADVEVSRKSPVGDFDLFSFKKGTNTLFSAYLGNQPHFPFEKGSSAKKARINKIQVESVEHQTKDGLHSKEILFHLTMSRGWPQRLHCWYSGLKAENALQVDVMLFTVRAH